MPVAVALIVSFLIGAPVTGALTLPEILALAGVLAKELPVAIKTEQQIVAFMQTPEFRAMVEANGDAAIRWQDRQIER